MAHSSSHTCYDVIATTKEQQALLECCKVTTRWADRHTRHVFMVSRYSMHRIITVPSSCTAGEARGPIEHLQPYGLLCACGNCTMDTIEQLLENMECVDFKPCWSKLVSGWHEAVCESIAALLSFDACREVLLQVCMLDHLLTECRVQGCRRTSP